MPKNPFFHHHPKGFEIQKSFFQRMLKQPGVNFMSQLTGKPKDLSLRAMGSGRKQNGRIVQLMPSANGDPLLSFCLPHSNLFSSLFHPEIHVPVSRSSPRERIEWED